MSSAEQEVFYNRIGMKYRSDVSIRIDY